jgi:hypothetical protein
MRARTALRRSTAYATLADPVRLSGRRDSSRRRARGRCAGLELGDSASFYLKTQRLTPPLRLPLRKWPSYLVQGLASRARGTRALDTLGALGVRVPELVSGWRRAPRGLLPRIAPCLITRELPGYIDLVRFLASPAPELGAAPAAPADLAEQHRSHSLHARGYVLLGAKYRNHPGPRSTAPKQLGETRARRPARVPGERAPAAFARKDLASAAQATVARYGRPSVSKGMLQRARGSCSHWSRPCFLVVRSTRKARGPDRAQPDLRQRRLERGVPVRPAPGARLRAPGARALPAVLRRRDGLAAARCRRPSMRVLWAHAAGRCCSIVLFRSSRRGGGELHGRCTRGPPLWVVLATVHACSSRAICCATRRAAAANLVFGTLVCSRLPAPRRSTRRGQDTPWTRHPARPGAGGETPRRSCSVPWLRAAGPLPDARRRSSLTAALRCTRAPLLHAGRGRPGELRTAGGSKARGCSRRRADSLRAGGARLPGLRAQPVDAPVACASSCRALPRPRCRTLRRARHARCSSSGARAPRYGDGRSGLTRHPLGRARPARPDALWRLGAPARGVGVGRRARLRQRSSA